MPPCPETMLLTTELKETAHPLPQTNTASPSALHKHPIISQSHHPKATDPSFYEMNEKSDVLKTSLENSNTSLIDETISDRVRAGYPGVRECSHVVDVEAAFPKESCNAIGWLIFRNSEIAKAEGLGLVFDEDEEECEGKQKAC